MYAQDNKNTFVCVCSCECAIRAIEYTFCNCGDHVTGDPPVLIPNTEVKPCRADDTGLVTSWESRTSPHFF